MSTYLTDLLEQKEPLEHHEVNDLKAWLGVLKRDVAEFGSTEEDTARIARIRAKIKENE